MSCAFGRIVRAHSSDRIDVGVVSAQAAAGQQSSYAAAAQPQRSCVDDRRQSRLLEGLGGSIPTYSLAQSYAIARGRAVFHVPRPPSRSEVPEYQDIRKSLAAAAGQINSRYGEFDWTPLRYINKSFSHQILTGFFRASRMALVTPLRDGMNLVAKEYVASQPADDPGVLVLSCFAGAARELGEAVIVNPFDIEGMAEAILQGLNMLLGERKERWTAMMKVVERNDITAWRESFVRALSASDVRQ